MLFSLEILQALQGDCLLLHFGSKTVPKLMVIDGGPSPVYDNFLKPRLVEIRQNRSPTTKLPIEMIMVSHIDDDHANGICALTDEMVSDGSQSPFSVKHLWVNSFDDIIGNDQLPAVSSLTAASVAGRRHDIDLPNLKKLNEEEIAVITSTPQGRQLRDNAKTLTLALNKPFKKMPGSGAVLVRGDVGQAAVPLGGLKITVVSPDQTRLKKLQTRWDTDLKKLKASGDKSIITATIASPDGSVFNLSSIVCLVESGTKKVLLTGDGLSKLILEGLKANNLLDGSGKLHVDILKMPHHGSIRNMTAEFLQKVTADNYVISANGRDDNPDEDLLNLLADNVTKGSLYFTNQDGKKDLKKKMEKFLKKLKDNGSKLKVNFLPVDKSSMLIELGDKINF